MLFWPKKRQKPCCLESGKDLVVDDGRCEFLIRPNQTPSLIDERFFYCKDFIWQIGGGVAQTPAWFFSHLLPTLVFPALVYLNYISISGSNGVYNLAHVEDSVSHAGPYLWTHFWSLRSEIVTCHVDGEAELRSFFAFLTCLRICFHSQKLDWGHQTQRPRAGKAAQLEVVCHRFPLCWCNNDVPKLQRVAGRTGQGVSDNQVAVGMVPGAFSSQRQTLWDTQTLKQCMSMGTNQGREQQISQRKFESVRWDLGTTANFETQGPLYILNVGPYYVLYIILNVSGIKYTYIVYHNKKVSWLLTLDIP